MRLALGSDHGGYCLKEKIKGELLACGHTVDDLGAYSEESSDYPDFARLVAKAVSQGTSDLGILVCGTGLGMSIAANKIPGIRAAVCSDTFSARAAREHNDANVLCLGERVVGPGLALDIVSVWLSAEFTGGHHSRRLGKISLMEKELPVRRSTCETTGELGQASGRGTPAAGASAGRYSDRPMATGGSTGPLDPASDPGNPGLDSLEQQSRGKDHESTPGGPGAAVNCFSSVGFLSDISRQIQEAVTGLLVAAGLEPGQVLVVGCSTSEISGHPIGRAPSLEIGRVVLDSLVHPLLAGRGIYLAVQCCEHLNRALVVELEAAQRYSWERVSVTPVVGAGGALAAAAWERFQRPVVVEGIEAGARAGLDIGATLIGMHLKPVVVPVRLSLDTIGRARLLAARSRPRFIGGGRAVYPGSTPTR